MIDMAKLKVGDLVLVYSPLRPDGSGLGSGSSGLHVVLAVGAHAATVAPASSLDPGKCQKVRPADLLAVLRPDQVDLAALPAGPRFQLDTPPPTKAAAPPTPPEPAPRMVKVRVIKPGPDGYEIVRLGSDRRGRGQVVTRYRPGAVVFVDQAGQPHHDFEVDSRDVVTFLGGVPGAYLADQAAAGKMPALVGEELPD